MGTLEFACYAWQATASRRLALCRAQGLIDSHSQASSRSAVSSGRVARSRECTLPVSGRRVEAQASVFPSVDASASLDSGDAAAPARLLPWCSTAQEEARAVNYALNGSMIALVMTASVTELAELVKGDFFSAHATLEGVRNFLNQSWEVYAYAVDAHPLAIKVR